MRKFYPDSEAGEKRPRTAPGVLVLKPLAPAAPARQWSTAGSSRGEQLRGEVTSVDFFRGDARPVSFAASSAALTHDARNLISAVSLYCELLRGPGVLAPEFLHYADDLERVGETGARLIEALTTPADPTPDPLPAPGPELTDIGAEISAMQGTLHALAGPEMCLEVECLPCAGRVALNSQDLLRILFNLVQNAREALQRHSSRPPARLRITAQPGPEEGLFSNSPPLSGRSVVVSVRDNGPGIPAEDLPHIFAAGYSGSFRDCRLSWLGGEAARVPHCGLGLTIVRHLVEAAGGQVRAISAAGLGTRFDIELPVLSGVLPRPFAGRGKRVEKISH